MSNNLPESMFERASAYQSLSALTTFGHVELRRLQSMGAALQAIRLYNNLPREVGWLVFIAPRVGYSSLMGYVVANKVYPEAMMKQASTRCWPRQGYVLARQRS